MTITVQDLVNREVHYCVSSLVSTLAKAFGSSDFQDDIRTDAGRDMMLLTEQAFELASPVDDYEEAAREAGWVEFDHPDEGPGLRNEKLDRDWPEVDWQAACDDCAVEPYQREVFEHWIVSDWLADKLEAKGEKVDKDFAGLTVWARTTTGQGVASDWVIEQIHADLVKP